MESKPNRLGMIAGMFPFDYFEGVQSDQVNTVLQKLYPVMSARFGADFKDFVRANENLSMGINMPSDYLFNLENLLRNIDKKAEELINKEYEERNAPQGFYDQFFPFDYFGNAQEAIEVLISPQKIYNLTKNKKEQEDTQKLKELKMRAADTILFEWMARFKEMILAKLAENKPN